VFPSKQGRLYVQRGHLVYRRGADMYRGGTSHTSAKKRVFVPHMCTRVEGREGVPRIYTRKEGVPQATHSTGEGKRSKGRPTLLQGQDKAQKHKKLRTAELRAL
jgi:hypothetical protein